MLKITEHFGKEMTSVDGDSKIKQNIYTEITIITWDKIIKTNIVPQFSTILFVILNLKIQKTQSILKLLIPLFSYLNINVTQK